MWKIEYKYTYAMGEKRHLLLAPLVYTALINIFFLYIYMSRGDIALDINHRHRWSQPFFCAFCHFFFVHSFQSKHEGALNSLPFVDYISPHFNTYIQHTKLKRLYRLVQTFYFCHLTLRPNEIYDQKMFLMFKHLSTLHDQKWFIKFLCHFFFVRSIHRIIFVGFHFIHAVVTCPL